MVVEWGWLRRDRQHPHAPATDASIAYTLVCGSY